MRKAPTHYTAWIVCGIIAITAHTIIHWDTFSLIPLPFLFSILLALLSPEPLLSLIAFGFFLELTSTGPIGLNMVIAFIPWLVRRILPMIRLELSFSLLGLLGSTVLLQTSVAFLPEILMAAHNGGLQQVLAILPWQIYFLTITLTTLLAYVIILVWQERRDLYA